MNETTPYRVLLVDDDNFICISLGGGLQRLGYHVTTAESGEVALDRLGRESFDVVISDLVMRRPDGLMVLRRSKELRPEVGFIILTGFGDLDSAVAAMRLGADDYVHKPCAARDLADHVDGCIEKQRRLPTLVRGLNARDATLRDIFHRVKNDYLLINGLINLQQGWVKEEDRIRFQELRSRVQVLALVHDHLQHSESYDSVDIGALLTDLCHRVASAQHAVGSQPDMHVDARGVTMAPDMAVPLGLIVNELVMNSFRYAFRPGERGRIAVVLKEAADGYTLSVSDDGHGFPEDISIVEPQTLGFRLVGALATQLRGVLDRRPATGTHITLRFPRSNRYSG